MTANGSIVSWGFDSSYGLISNTPTESGFSDIAAGERHSLALTANGSIVAWGYDFYGQRTKMEGEIDLAQVPPSKRLQVLEDIINERLGYTDFRKNFTTEG